jgi:hypothetical protein
LIKALFALYKKDPQKESLLVFLINKNDQIF